MFKKLTFLCLLSTLLFATLRINAQDSPIRLWISPDVPPEFTATFEPLIADGRYVLSPETEAQIRFSTNTGTPIGLSAYWYYAPVVPFPTIPDNITWGDIQAYWQGKPEALSYLSGNGEPPVFVAAQSTVNWLTAKLGAPASNVGIEIVPPEGVAAGLWLRRPSAWSLVPFDRLDPSLKVLTVDGVSIFDRLLNVDKYPLIEVFSFTGDPIQVNNIIPAVWATGKWFTTNRDPLKMTILVMTGVTALTRATAYQMEVTGIDLPARDILPFFLDADFVHTSNEVSFNPDCGYPDPTFAGTGLKFCSRVKYFDLLKTSRMNIIELTGNHGKDYGAAAFLYSIDLYNANGMRYFGGGKDIDDAKKALTIEHNGNKIAFIGCNPVGPQYAWAGAGIPGAAPCDDAYLGTEIPRLKMASNLVIMTLQYNEYYQYAPPADQVTFFKKYNTLGADLVMGSQAHQPQGFAFPGQGFIHYGIGNIYFDQMDYLATRQMFADKIIFYNGKHLSTLLFTGISEDYSRPRPMTDAERRTFLSTIFKASGW